MFSSHNVPGGTNVVFRYLLGETSKLIGCSLHIQQPAAANLYRKCYTLLLKPAAFWLQPAVMNVDVSPYSSTQDYNIIKPLIWLLNVTFYNTINRLYFNPLLISYQTIISGRNQLHFVEIQLKHNHVTSI